MQKKPLTKFSTHFWLKLLKNGHRSNLLQLAAAATAAAAKSLQSCPTLCNSVDGSPPGSPVPGILQARTLEWVAISFSNAWKWSRSVVSNSATPWTAAYQAPPFMGFSRQEYWNEVPLPSPPQYRGTMFCWSIYLLVDIFTFLAMENNASTNIHVQAFVCFHLFWVNPWWMVGHMLHVKMLTFFFFRNCQISKELYDFKFLPSYVRLQLFCT